MNTWMTFSSSGGATADLKRNDAWRETQARRINCTQAEARTARCLDREFRRLDTNGLLDGRLVELVARSPRSLPAT
jgi:hypothetical protein